MFLFSAFACEMASATIASAVCCAVIVEEHNNTKQSRMIFFIDKSFEILIILSGSKFLIDHLIRAFLVLT
jgi:hypothetical protein